ncbi:MAG: hypothetical protein ABIP48_23765, partial [Planctomycetota bacterium]
MSDHASNTSHDERPRPQVPDFDLLRQIGEGGFGQVWLARNRTTGRLRALKLIPLRRSGRADPAGREIVSLTHLESRVESEHPNLLAIHHVGKTADHLFYVMDLAGDSGNSAGRRPAGAGGVPPRRPAVARRVGVSSRGGHGPSRREAVELPVRRGGVEAGRFWAL